MTYCARYRLGQVIVTATIISVEGEDKDAAKDRLNRSMIAMAGIGPERFSLDEPLGISGNKKS